MATCGERLCFHGSYGKKTQAEEKLRALGKKARILKRFVGGRAGNFRYIVATPKK